MKQVWIFHGGESFSSYEAYLAALTAKQIDYERLKPQPKWRDWMAGQLPGIDVLTPTMPNSSNAQFDEWKIYFEKLIPFFSNDIQLVGHSLGAMFLAKYLNDYPLKHAVRRLILIAGGYDDASNEDLGSFAVGSAQNLVKSAGEIHLFHSTDDFVVPFSELEKFQHDIPHAVTHTFDDKGHFLDPEFPELRTLLQHVE